MKKMRIYVRLRGANLLFSLTFFSVTNTHFALDAFQTKQKCSFIDTLMRENCVQQTRKWVNEMAGIYILPCHCFVSLSITISFRQSQKQKCKRMKKKRWKENKICTQLFALEHIWRETTHIFFFSFSPQKDVCFVWKSICFHLHIWRQRFSLCLQTRLISTRDLWSPNSNDFLVFSFGRNELISHNRNIHFNFYSIIQFKIHKFICDKNKMF